ncbi:phosphate ABC transporter substrate-binding protein PstS [Nocardioides sp.]|uniref:phosphate ABC transporter substrate-binding protein PstS n=1 Tax=Nocardioides sp. TaxID=35761 RepID=UPI00286AFA8C|nr:phosphate ABC transporter substrate-binding protein PstS [Nocardioides sp.]
MNRPRTIVRSLLTITLAFATLLVQPGTASATVYAQIEGTGSTWSELIVQQWIADVDANGMKVVYTGGGSSKGRKDFSQNSTDFAISEIPYQGTDETGQADTSNGREFAYLPIVAGGTAFTYQLKIGNELVRNLRLSGETIAKIFTNQITNWNDAAITADNNGRAFPSLPITPVVRSDGSGTTAQFTTWLDSEFPSIWRPFFGGSGLTSYYPKESGSRAIGQAGSDQVMNTISGFAGNGTIGYVEYSYPVNKDYPVVKVLNKAGYYVEPTQYNVAVALTRAKINQDKSSALYLTQILDGVYRNTDARAYPISSYSYMVIPTGADDPRMTTAKRQTIADFLYYSLCAGQTKAGPYGYSPLPLNLVQAGFEQISRLKQADSAVDLTDRDVRSCNNPTFDGKNLNKNQLAAIAPAPAACDKQGEGPCGTATGTNEPSTDEGGAATPDGGQAGGGAASPTGTGAGSGTPGAGSGAAGGNAPPPVIDPATGAVVGGTSTGAATSDAIYANPTELAADRALDTRTFGWLAALLAVGLVVVPGFYAASLRRRRKPGTVR